MPPVAIKPFPTASAVGVAVSVSETPRTVLPGICANETVPECRIVPPAIPMLATMVCTPADSVPVAFNVPLLTVMLAPTAVTVANVPDTSKTEA